MMHPLRRFRCDSGAILVGGSGRRLGGVEKGLIEVDGQTVIERLIGMLGVHLAPIHLIGDSDAYRGFSLPVFGDVMPARGSPGGVHAALHHAPPGWVFVCACDMPALCWGPIATLREHADLQDAVLYRARGQLQPLAGWWHTRAAGRLAEILHAAERPPGFGRLTQQLAVDVVEIDATEPFTNLNLPEELAEAGAHLPDRQCS